MDTENIKIGNIYIEDSNCLFIKDFIILVITIITTCILLEKTMGMFITTFLSPLFCLMFFFIIFHKYFNNNDNFDKSICFLHFTTNVNFDDIEKLNNVFNIIKTQYEKETIIEKNTKYNYKVKLKIQTNDIEDSTNMEYIKNWIQEQRKNNYETINKSI